MLAYILAVLVGMSSVGLYLWAFFFPEIHRKQDFIWSGVGLFYALFLWLYAHQVTGGILVGQTTSVALLGWFAWETFKLRRQLVPVNRSTSPIAPNPTQHQNQRDSQPKAVKPTTKTPPQSPSPTPSAPIPTPTPIVTTAQTAPVATSIPLAQTKVPPATPGSVPTTSKAAPPQPTPQPANAVPTKVVPSNPTSSTTSSPANASPPQISQSIDSVVPVKISATTPTISPAAKSIDVTEEAWIKLEVKPAPAPVKPLGMPVQPPTAAKVEVQSPAVVPEIVTKSTPTDPAPTITELESENWV
jgi:Ycf66 protein N-terminus